MAPLPGESLRAQARRESTTVYQARISRAEGRGVSRSVAAGQAGRSKERGLAPSRAQRSWLKEHGGSPVKSRGLGNGNQVVISKDRDGRTQVQKFDASEWDDLESWFEQEGVDHEEYF